MGLGCPSISASSLPTITTTTLLLSLHSLSFPLCLEANLSDTFSQYAVRHASRWPAEESAPLLQHAVDQPGPVSHTYIYRPILQQILTSSLRNIIFILVLLRYTRRSFYSLRGYGLLGSLRNIYLAVRLFLFSIFLRLPGVRGQVDKQVTTAIEGLESKLVATGPDLTRYLTLPKNGWSPEQIRKELDHLANLEHTRWEDGRVSGAVYHGGKDLLKLQTEAFGQFGVANPIHPDVFPGVRKMEAEVVAMVVYSFLLHLDCADVFRFWHCSMPRPTVLVSPPAEARSLSLWRVSGLDRRLTLNAV